MFDPSLVQTTQGDLPVAMHFFERTVEMEKHNTQREYYFPLQTVFAVKEKNGGKLHSHLWFFMGMATQMDPK